MSPELISPSDPRYFSQTSDGPYDRHQYKLFYTSGKEQVVDDWETAQSIWFQSPSNWLSHIEVLDKKKTKKSKGFS